MSDYPIYLDNQATTPMDPRVLEAMLPYFKENFGNPHSEGHSFGWTAGGALDQSRALVAKLVGADAREIVFTSGATESCNIALRGIANKNLKRRKRIVTVATEHASVLGTCIALQDDGFEVVILPVQRDGIVDLNIVQEAVNTQTLVVSVMLANNEIGVIQPIREISKICQKVGAYLHTDATQAVGKIPVDVQFLDVDFMSFSAHKFYGSKGIGALYTRWGNLDALQPLTTGGGQEIGLRPGTVAVPLVVGFGEASYIAQKEIKKDMEHTGQLAKKLYTMLQDRIPEVQLFGHPLNRLPGNLSIGFPNVSGEDVIARVGECLAISTGSACSSVSAEVSHVLEALGIGDDAANSGVRISIGRFNRAEEIQKAVDILVEATKY